MASNDTPTIAKDLVNASGWLSFPSCPPNAKTGRNEISMIRTLKKIGPPTSLARRDDHIFGDIPADGSYRRTAP